MAAVNKKRNMLEGLVREGSFKWLMRQQSSLFDEETHGETNELCELSSMANAVIRRCSKILALSVEQLRECFVSESSDPLKHQSNFARNFLEYCCFMTLARAIQEVGYLADSKFRRLTFDMMISWEYPDAACETLSPVTMDDHNTVGVEAFARIAPAIPLVSNVVISDKLFEVLTASTNNRLHYSVYDKYLARLERAIQKWKAQSESSLLSSLRSNRVEKILEVDGTVTTQPVFEHVGKSAWPGRLVLTDHALYFEALKVVTYDKAKVYDLADELQQVVRPELTGPWGSKLFDRAVFYNSISLSEPIIMGFPELKGHARRDYWLAIIREVLNAHRFLLKFHISGPEREEVLLKAVFGILRLQALKELITTVPLPFDSLLMFNVCDHLPGGDVILEKLASMLTVKDLVQRTDGKSCNGMYSVSALLMASNLGFPTGTSSSSTNYDREFVVGEMTVGETTALEKAVREAKSSYESVVLAQASIDGVKLSGIGTKLAVMKELISPALECWNLLAFLHNWEDPFKSSAFCAVFTYAIFRGWIAYAIAATLIFTSLSMFLTRFYGRGKHIHELKVNLPPSMNAVDQLLAVQSAVSKAEEFIQDGNIILLKCRALFLSIFPKATERTALVLLIIGLFMALVPIRYISVLFFLEIFTRYSPFRRAGTERCMRRCRDWWFSIPAAPVIVEKKASEEKKKR